jgi:hypothetical protein
VCSSDLPSTCITWIGVTFNSVNMTMRIPTNVIRDTITLVANWLVKTTATRHDLQVILGKLFHAGKCCKAARIFVGRMLGTLRSTPPSGYTTLSEAFRADLHWWHEMLPYYNGRLLIQLSRPNFHVHIDTQDDTVAVYTHTHVCTASIPPTMLTSIQQWAHKECFATLLALRLLLWGQQSAETEFILHCTDPAALQVLIHGRSRDTLLLNIARRIWLITARHDIELAPRPHDHTCIRGTCVLQPPTEQLFLHV